MNNQKNMQNQNITTSNMPKENPMIMFKQGDKIRATVIVYVDGVKMKQPELNNKTITLGADEFLPGFDKLLLDTKYSQNFILEFKADDKYEYEPFKGKNIKFEIIIHEHEPSEYKKCLDELEQTKKEIEQLKKELEQTKENLNKKTNEHNQEIQNMNKTFKIKLLEVSKKAEDEVKEEKARTSKLFEEQKKEAKMYALQKFMEDFLSPYASLKMAILAGKKNENPVVKNFIIGFDMIVKQLENVFSDWNINLIYPTVGEQFDANTQQILEQVEDPNLPNHSIKMVHSIGFKLYDRLIKPALVVSVLNSNQKTKQNDDKNINESKSLEEESSSSSSRVENEDKSSTNDFVNEQTTKEFRQEILKEQPPLSKKEQKKLAKEEKKRLKLQKKEEKKRLKLAKKEQKKLTKLAKKNKNAILNNKEKTTQENNAVVEQESQQITDEKINENLNVSKTNEELKKEVISNKNIEKSIEITSNEEIQNLSNDQKIEIQNSEKILLDENQEHIEQIEEVSNEQEQKDLDELKDANNVIHHTETINIQEETEEINVEDTKDEEVIQEKETKSSNIKKDKQKAKTKRTKVSLKDVKSSKKETKKQNNVSFFEEIAAKKKKESVKKDGEKILGTMTQEIHNINKTEENIIKTKESKIASEDLAKKAKEAAKNKKMQKKL